MKITSLLLLLLMLVSHAKADSFYVAYQWQKPEGSPVTSWATGFIHEDIDTEKGIKALIRLLQQKNKIITPVVILYLKKLKPEPTQPPNKKPYIKGRLI